MQMEGNVSLRRFESVLLVCPTVLCNMAEPLAVHTCMDMCHILVSCPTLNGGLGNKSQHTINIFFKNATAGHSVMSQKQGFGLTFHLMVRCDDKCCYCSCDSKRLRKR